MRISINDNKLKKLSPGWILLTKQSFPSVDYKINKNLLKF